ncbi:MAG: hypothetical protein RIE73_33845 [Coleofasciculus sp. C1-SOL-03]
MNRAQVFAPLQFPGVILIHQIRCATPLQVINLFCLNDRDIPATVLSAINNQQFTAMLEHWWYQLRP